MPSRTFIDREERSVSDFKGSKDRLTLLLGTNAADNLELKPVLICHSENSRALKNYAKTILPVTYEWNNKAWMTAPLFITWFTDYLKPTVDATALNKGSFKIFRFINNAPGHPRPLMEMFKI